MGKREGDWGTLINFDNTVDFSNKPEARHESNGAGQQEEQKHHNQGVTEVQEGRCCVFNRQFRGEIVTAINEKINGGATGCQK